MKARIEISMLAMYICAGVPAQRPHDRSAQPLLGGRHYLYPHARWLRLSGRHRRLGHTHGAGPSGVDRHEHGRLRRGAGRSDCHVWPARAAGSTTSLSSGYGRALSTSTSISTPMGMSPKPDSSLPDSSRSTTATASFVLGPTHTGYDILQPTDSTGSVMRIRFPTALLAYGLAGPSASSTVDNLNPQRIHLRNPKICPNKPSHLLPTEFT